MTVTVESKPEMTAVEMLSSLMNKEISVDYDLAKVSALSERYEVGGDHHDGA